MKLAKAKEYYELDLLTVFTAVKVDDQESGWILCIAGKEDRSWTLHTALGKEKVYSTLDSLSADVQRILGDEAKAPPWSFKL